MTQLPMVSGGSGPRFLRHTGTAAPLLPPRAVEGVLDVRALFDGERYESPSFLVSTGDFDAGEAPETAAAGLMALGVRGFLATGFERGFYDACFAQGLLPVILDEVALRGLTDRIESETTEMAVDLEAQTIEAPGMETLAFEMDPRRRNKLLLGLTDMDEALRHADDIAALRSADRTRRPWVYDWRK